MLTLNLPSSLDRSNVSNANTAGLEDDLNLVGNQFNQSVLRTFFFFLKKKKSILTFHAARVLTYYQIPFIVLGPVFTVVTKMIGARYSLSAMLLTFGTASLATGFVKNYGSLIACRVIVGIAESGFLAS